MYKVTGAPKVMHFGTCKFQSQIYQQLQGYQVPGAKFVNISRFFKHFIFRFAVLAAKSLNCGGDRDVGEGSDAMPEQSAENQPPQTHSARDHVPPAVTYVPGIPMWRWSEK